MTNEVVERVAMTLYAQDCTPSAIYADGAAFWPNEPERRQREYRARVCAVIDAMRDPTMDMLQAADDACVGLPTWTPESRRDLLRTALNAMIDVAQKED